MQADVTLSFVRRVMNWHAGRSDDFRSPIVRDMAKTKPGQRRRQRILSDEDGIRAVWRAAEAPAKHFHQAGAVSPTDGHTPQRAPVWSAASSPGPNWIIPERRYKNGLQLLVPLSPAAQDVLAKTPHIGDRLVFTNNGKHALASSRSSSRSSTRRRAPRDGRSTTCGEQRRSLVKPRAGVSVDHAERCPGPRHGRCSAAPTTSTAMPRRSAAPSRRWPASLREF